MKINLKILIINFFTNTQLFRYCDSGKFNPDKKGNKYIIGLVIGIFILIFTSAESYGLSAQYDMNFLGSATQTAENGNLKIEAITDVDVKLPFSYRIKYFQNIIYEHGLFKKLHVETYKNGKLNSTVLFNLEGLSCQLIVNGDTTVINDTITYSESLIYFTKSQGIDRVYKERSAEMKKIIPVIEHAYVIRDESEKEMNRNVFENGKLQHMQIRHILGTIELKREAKD